MDFYDGYEEAFAMAYETGLGKGGFSIWSSAELAGVFPVNRRMGLQRFYKYPEMFIFSGGGSW